MAPPFKFDEVNAWSEIKLEIVENTVPRTLTHSPASLG
jgi:hypothetical protein